MVLNKRGQVMFYTIMLSVVVVIIALAMTPVVKTFVDDARNTTTDSRQGLDCANTSISDFQQAQCVMVDLATPYFFFAFLGIAGIIIGAKVILGGGAV